MTNSALFATMPLLLSVATIPRSAIQSTQAGIHTELATMDTKQEPVKDSVGKLKPVLQLRVHKFRETPETTFPLYPGFNKVGRNPDNSTVWLPMPFISACHVTIGIHNLDHFPPRVDVRMEGIPQLITFVV